MENNKNKVEKVNNNRETKPKVNSSLIIKAIFLAIAIFMIFDGIGTAKDKNVILNTQNATWEEFQNIEILNGAFNEPITTVLNAIKVAQSTKISQGYKKITETIKNFHIEIEDSSILQVLITPINWIISIVGFIFNFQEQIINFLQAVIIIITNIIIPK